MFERERKLIIFTCHVLCGILKLYGNLCGMRFVIQAPLSSSKKECKMLQCLVSQRILLANFLSRRVQVTNEVKHKVLISLQYCLTFSFYKGYRSRSVSLLSAKHPQATTIILTITTTTIYYPQSPSSGQPTTTIGYRQLSSPTTIIIPTNNHYQ